MDSPLKPAAAAQPPASPQEKAGNPTTLLDLYEVESIMRELERLLDKESGGDAGVNGHRRRKKPTVARLAPPPGKKGSGGVELLGRQAVAICGGSVAISPAAAAGRGGTVGLEKA